jgi:hypothetical protein
MMSPSAKSCHTTGFVKVVGAGGVVVGGVVVGGVVVGGVVVGAVVGGVVVGVVAPVQATPLTAKPVGAGLLPVHEPLNPNETVPLVAIAPL